MPNYNKITLIGNVTRDIEIRYTPSGTAVADISLAINRKRTGENGQSTEETTFVDVTLWGSTAEIVHKYSGKGQPLFVEGRLQADSWEDKTTGQKRTKLKVVAENIQLLGSKPAGSPANQEPARQQSQQPQRYVEDIDDIPF